MLNAVSKKRTITAINTRSVFKECCFGNDPPQYMSGKMVDTSFRDNTTNFLSAAAAAALVTKTAADSKVSGMDVTGSSTVGSAAFGLLDAMSGRA